MNPKEVRVFLLVYTFYSVGTVLFRACHSSDMESAVSVVSNVERKAEASYLIANFLMPFAAIIGPFVSVYVGARFSRRDQQKNEP